MITAARHYWNAALPLINQPMERELLQEPVSQILDFIADTTDKNKYKKTEVSELLQHSSLLFSSVHELQRLYPGLAFFQGEKYWGRNS